MLGWLLGRRDDLDGDEEYDEEFDPDAELDELLDEDAPHEVSLDCDCDTCDERWRTAVHEAGHVVAFHALGEPFEYVTISPDRDEDEEYNTDGASNGGHVHMDQGTDDMFEPDEIRNYLIIGAAGVVAEEAVRGVGTGGAHDEQMIAELLERPACPIDQDEAVALAEEIVADHYDEMIGIAEDLFEHDTLSYTDTV
jgi:hypothetical protein